MSLWIAADDATFVVGQRDGTLRTWNTDERGGVDTLAEGVTEISSASLGETHALLQSERWMILDRSNVLTPLSVSQAIGEGSHAELSVSGEVVAVRGGSKDTVEILRRTPSGFRAEGLIHFPSKINGFVLDREGQRLATRLGDKEIVLWRGPNWADALRLSAQHETIHLGVFSADGALFYAGTGDGRLQVWDANSGLLLQALPAHRGAVEIWKTADPGRAISVGLDSSIQVWNLVTQTAEKTVTDLPRMPVGAVVRGSLLQAWFTDGQFGTWDLDSNVRLTKVFSPEGIADITERASDVLVMTPEGRIQRWPRIEPVLDSEEQHWAVRCRSPFEVRTNRLEKQNLSRCFEYERAPHP